MRNTEDYLRISFWTSCSDIFTPSPWLDKHYSKGMMVSAANA